MCFQIGKNIGLAFQLADDIVDFVGAASKSDKPTNADLASGLATAPVFFAAFERNDLNFLIMRQFGEKGDVKLARDLTLDSSGVQETEVMIHNHIESAQQLTQKYFGDDPVRTELLNLQFYLQDSIINRISKEKMETLK